MIIYYAYSTDPSYAQRQAATKQAIPRLLDYFSAWGWTWRPTIVGADSRYEDGVKAYWGQDDLIIWEQDIVPTPDMFMAFAACPHPLCTQAYCLHHPSPWSANLRQPRLVQRQLLPGQRRRWTIVGEKWTDYTGIGLVRIRKEWAAAHPPAWPSGEWSSLDARMGGWQQPIGPKWHMHYPIAAHHHQSEGEIPP